MPASSLNPVYCRHCRKEIGDTNKFCPECGQSQSANPTAAPVVTPRLPSAYAPPATAPVVAPRLPTVYAPTAALAETPAAPVLRCGHCGNKNVRKVSAIVSSQTWSSRSTGYTSGLSTDGRGHYGSYSGTTSTYSSGGTPLAESLAAPYIGKEIGGATYVGMFLTCGVLLIQGIVLSSTPAAGAGIFEVILVVCLLVGFSAYFSKHNQNVISKTPQWEAEIRVWKRLTYCAKCDHVTDPEDGWHNKRSNWRSLLNRV